MKRLLPVLMGFVFLLLSSTEGWSADFQKGMNAFDKGYYATALREWKPLAENKGILSYLNSKEEIISAQYNLGLMYEYGQGVPKDYKTAVKWYTLAAEQGAAAAQYNLGVMYEQGRGVPQDDKTAVKWWKLAAEQGDADAQHNLGGMHHKGKGVPQNEKTAVKWYRLAAEQGDASAQYALGLMYEYGQGVPKDYKTAVKWYTLSAEQGFADAQYNLGVMYYKGQESFKSLARPLGGYRAAILSHGKTPETGATPAPRIHCCVLSLED